MSRTTTFFPCRGGFKTFILAFSMRFLSLSCNGNLQWDAGFLSCTMTGHHACRRALGFVRGKSSNGMSHLEFRIVLDIYSLQSLLSNVKVILNVRCYLSLGI